MRQNWVISKREIDREVREINKRKIVLGKVKIEDTGRWKEREGQVPRQGKIKAESVYLCPCYPWHSAPIPKLFNYREARMVSGYCFIPLPFGSIKFKLT